MRTQKRQRREEGKDDKGLFYFLKCKDCCINPEIGTIWEKFRQYFCTFAPQTGNKFGTLSTAYNNDYTAIIANFDLKGAKGPIIQGSAVIGYQGWLAGYQAAFDAENKKLTKNNFTLGFSTGDFILHTNLDLSEFDDNIYQRVSPRLETAIQLAWSSGSDDIKLGTIPRNTSQIGLGYKQRLRDGITLTPLALIGGKNINGGGHKFSLNLELDA
nr:voltage-dependent anion-selective channel protein 2-like [Onthophagus taurus]